MKRVLVFGGSGQLGTALRSSVDWSADLIAPTSQELPIDDASMVRSFIEETKPHVIVNAAAYTRVDDAEGDIDRAYLINATAPGIMAAGAKAVGARFMHVSTDYVFNGSGEVPYSLSEAPNPINAYGASKLAGEIAVHDAMPSAVIVRTAWVHSGGGTNFVGTAVRLLGSGKSMRVVDDQIGTPTRAANLAKAIQLMSERPSIYGIQHFTDAGVASWYDVADCVLGALQRANRAPADVTITPVMSSEYPTRAKRPRVSVLDTHKTRTDIEWTPPHWQVGVIASTMEWLGEHRDA